MAPYVLFFFQAEDGIRDDLVTGVQTCALPISEGGRRHHRREVLRGPVGERIGAGLQGDQRRSEERRVGKECRSRGWPDHEKKKRGVDGVSVGCEFHEAAAASLVWDADDTDGLR